MIVIFSFNKSLKSPWIKEKYFDVNNKGSWKTFFNLEFHQFGGELLLLFDKLHKSDIPSVSNYSGAPRAPKARARGAP